MDFIIAVLTGLALAMDCFAISICITGLSKTTWKTFLQVPLYFGTFHVIMPIIGFYLGVTFQKFITPVDHWVAFTILLIIGVKLIVESLKSPEKLDLASNTKLFFLTIATSIDALIIGIALSIIEKSIIFTALTIGITTALVSFTGLLLGKKIKQMKLNYAGIAGGIVLICIGLKTLLEHLLK